MGIFVCPILIFIRKMRNVNIVHFLMTTLLLVLFSSDLASKED